LVPSAHKESEVYFAWVCRPTTFRLQGLATLLAVCSLRVPADLFSCRRRSWDSPFGGFPSRKVSSAFPPKMHPPTVPLSGIPAAEAPGRPDEFRFLGFNPSESPLWLGRCLAYRPPDPPLGFALPGFARGNLGRDSAQPPLTRFINRTHTSPALPAPQSLSQLPLGLIVPSHRSTTLRRGNPLRVFAPARSRAFERESFRAMSSPHPAPGITAD
jgi:hypothetical protein